MKYENLLNYVNAFKPYYEELIANGFSKERAIELTQQRVFEHLEDVKRRYSENGGL